MKFKAMGRRSKTQSSKLKGRINCQSAGRGGVKGGVGGSVKVKLANSRVANWNLELGSSLEF